MDLCKILQVIVLMFICIFTQHFGFSEKEEKIPERTDILTTTRWGVDPDSGSWSLNSKIPMTSEYDDSWQEESGRGKKIKKFKKKFGKFLLPLLLAYKLKFFTLIPVFIGGLLLLTGATGLAGFFFALFAAVMGLKHHH